MEIGDIVNYNGFVAKIIQEVGSSVLVSFQERDKHIQTIERVSLDSLTKISQTNQYEV